MTVATVSPLINEPIGNELVTFIQHQLPGMEAGVYQLEVKQWINDRNDQPISDEDLQNKYEFAIQGDRFALSDPLTVDSVFPADNATGEFGTVLPHVVFTKTTLPWTRTPQTPALLETDPDVATWLAVLLFDEDDALPSLDPTASKIGNLFPPSLVEGSTLENNYSYFNHAKDTKLEPGQSLDDPILTLDVPLSLFWRVAPAMEDLKLLAHVRQVNLLTKATLAGTVGPGVPTGTYSIVFGNRLPQSSKPPLVGKKTFAYLVSLEGLQAYLPDEDGTPPSGDWKGTLLRVAVLTNWAFYSVGQSATFVNSLLSLNGHDPDSKDEAAITNLRLPYGGSNPVVKAALHMGYAPLNTNLRSGEKTVSWFRGPLTPYEVGPRVVHVPVSSADEANRFDPTTGFVNQSYGGAWTLGRMLALQDPAFSTALYNWKSGLTQRVVDAIEDELLAERFEPILNSGPVPRALQGRETPPSRSLLHKTVQALGRVAVARKQE